MLFYHSGGAPDGSAVGYQDAGVSRARGAGHGARHPRRHAAAPTRAAAGGARAGQPPSATDVAAVPHALLQCKLVAYLTFTK